MQSKPFSFDFPLSIGKNFLGNLHIEGDYKDNETWDITHMSVPGGELALFNYIDNMGDASINNAITAHIEYLMSEEGCNDYYTNVMQDFDEMPDAFERLGDILNPKNNAA